MSEPSSEDPRRGSIRFGEFLRHASVRYGEIRYGDLSSLNPGGKATRIGVTPRHVLRILTPYLSVRFGEQLRAVVPLALYLALFQAIILRQSVLGSLGISLGLFAVIVGLMLFMEGLKVGLMPFAEMLGTELPVKLKLGTVVVVAFIIGAAATFAEPAISVLQSAGASVSSQDAPLLHALLNRYSLALVLAVAVGVGFATILGVQRSLRGWSLKPLIFATLVPTLLVTIYAYVDSTGQVERIIGLAWDCGGVTTGPVTVPLVLALGIGVAHAANRDDGFSGFGVVTLASVLPILMVLILSIVLLHTGGAEAPESAAVVTPDEATTSGLMAAGLAVLGAARAVLPLCLLLIAILVWLLKTPIPTRTITFYGMALALVGMAVFNLGLTFGLGALGEQVGHIMPAAFQNQPAIQGSPIYDSAMGKGLALLFAFFLGLGATLAEPALRALAMTVENVTNGAMERGTVIGAVSVGVGVGITVGVAKIIWGFSITPILLLGYGILLVLTVFSSEKFVNVAWDSAGVTTGPVTVPLVIALGLGLGQASGVVEGFGILAMASLFPIGSVLIMGLLSDWRLARQRGLTEEVAEELAEASMMN
jgi:hypothetical protein